MVRPAAPTPVILPLRLSHHELTDLPRQSGGAVPTPRSLQTARPRPVYWSYTGSRSVMTDWASSRPSTPEMVPLKEMQADHTGPDPVSTTTVARLGPPPLAAS